MEGGSRGILIVVSAFMIQFLAFGNYSIIGIYTVHLLHVFENDAVGVSLISAIHSALLLCSGKYKDNILKCFCGQYLSKRDFLAYLLIQYSSKRILDISDCCLVRVIDILRYVDDTELLVENAKYFQ